MPYAANARIEQLYDSAPMVRTLDRLTHRVGDRLTATVKRRTPVARLPPGVTPQMRGRMPGTLKESWQTSGVERARSASGTEARAIESYTEDPVAPDVEYPTRPHWIRPRPDRAAASVVATGKPRRMGDDPGARLRFVNAFGHVVYAAEVWHPGTQGTHMMRDSLAEIDATWVERDGAPEMRQWAREQKALVR